MRDSEADHVVMRPLTNSASSGAQWPQWDTERPAEPGRKETQKSQALPSHPKGFLPRNSMKRTVKVCISTHNTGDLHQTFNLQLNVILEEGCKSYHYNVNSYFLKGKRIRFHF